MILCSLHGTNLELSAVLMSDGKGRDVLAGNKWEIEGGGDMHEGKAEISIADKNLLLCLSGRKGHHLDD